MNEKAILIGGGVLLLALGVFVLPSVMQKSARAPSSSALSVPGPRVAEPIPGAGQEAPSAPASSQAAPAAPAASTGAAASPPSEASSTLEQANRRYQKEDFAGALPYFRKYLETHEDADVLTSLAVCLRRTGNVPEALEKIERSLKLKPEGLEARYYLGLIQEYDLADLDAAIATFEQVLPRLPKEHVAELKDNVDYMKRVREKLTGKAAARSAVPSPSP
jgi:tetratricopeptide (TPR) repeat protein